MQRVIVYMLAVNWYLSSSCSVDTFLPVWHQCCCWDIVQEWHVCVLMCSWQGKTSSMVTIHATMLCLDGLSAPHSEHRMMDLIDCNCGLVIQHWSLFQIFKLVPL